MANENVNKVTNPHREVIQETNILPDDVLNALQAWLMSKQSEG